MQIAVCDDVQRDMDKILAALDSYAKSHPQLRFDLDEYPAAIELLSEVEKGKIYDIAILDICMPGILGTDAAREILSKSPDTGVIFLSVSDEYAVAAFALNAVHYLLKPFTQEQFDAAMDRALQKAETKDLLTLPCVNGVYRVRMSEMIVIESQGHYLSVCLASGEMLRLRRTLSRMFEEMQGHSEFIRIGASYIVNLSFVRKIAANNMEMINGVRVPVPRRSGEAVQRAYMDFCRREAMK